MKIIKEFILTVLMCAVVAIPVVNAQEQANAPEANERHERMEKAIQEIYSQLNLTDDQKKQLESNKEDQRAQRKSAFESMKNQREALHQELMKADLDMNKINGIQAQLKAAQAQMLDNRLNSILEVRKILTPEQFNKFITLMKEHRGKGMGKGMGKRKGPQDEMPE